MQNVTGLQQMPKQVSFAYTRFYERAREFYRMRGNVVKRALERNCRESRCKTTIGNTAARNKGRRSFEEPDRIIIIIIVIIFLQLLACKPPSIATSAYTNDIVSRAAFSIYNLRNCSP